MAKIVGRVIVFLTLFGVIFFIFNWQVVRAPNTLLKCQPHEITALSISETGTFLSMHEDKKSNNWILRYQNETFPVDLKTLDGLRGSVCFVIPDESFALHAGQSPSEYGFDKPGHIMTITTARRTDTLFFGNLSPQGTHVFVMKSQDPKTVYTIPNTYEKRLFANFMDLHRKYPIVLRDAKQVDVMFKGTRLSLKRSPSEGTWGGSVASDLVPLLLQSLEGTWFTNYHHPATEKEAETFGFYLTDSTITVTYSDGKKDTYELTLFNHKYYMKFRAANQLFVLILDQASGARLWDALSASL